MLRSSLAVISVLALLAAAGFGGMGRGAIGSNGVLIGILASRILPPVVIVLPLYVMARHRRARYALDPHPDLYGGETSRRGVVVAAGFGKQGDGPGGSGSARRRCPLSHLVPGPGANGGGRHCGGGPFDFRPVLERISLLRIISADNHAMTMPPFLAAQMSVREQQAGSDAEEWARLSAAIILMTAPLIACAQFAQRFLTRLSPWGRVQG